MTDTNVQLVLNSRDRTSGTYNSSLYNAKGQNIIQGSIKQITVSEVNFPYDIPNVQAGFNFFYLDCLTSTGPDVVQRLTIIVTPSFYTGSDLADAINLKIRVAAFVATPVIASGSFPVLSFDGTNNVFTFAPPTSPSAPAYGVWNILSPYTFPQTLPRDPNLGKDLLSIMGFNYYTGVNNIVQTTGDVSVSGGSAPLIFTQYIDICSSQLCKNQYMSDGSTTNLARRSDVICRLFVCDNASLTQTDADGTRPFIINRQYYNARMMKWTVGAAIGTVDINLYDDVGQPLLTTWIPRPFQITFNCHENPRDEGFR